MKTKFIPFTAEKFSAETPFRAKFAGSPEPVSVVFNQYGQLLAADTRRLVDPLPVEMEVTEEKADSPAPVKP